MKHFPTPEQAKLLPLHATPFERRPFVVSEAMYEALIDKRVTQRRLDLALAVQAHEYGEHKREWAAKFGHWCRLDGSLPREQSFNRRWAAEGERLIDEAESQLSAMVPCEVRQERVTWGMTA